MYSTFAHFCSCRLLWCLTLLIHCYVIKINWFSSPFLVIVANFLCIAKKYWMEMLNIINALIFIVQLEHIMPEKSIVCIERTSIAVCHTATKVLLNLISFRIHKFVCLFSAFSLLYYCRMKAFTFIIKYSYNYTRLRFICLFKSNQTRFFFISSNYLFGWIKWMRKSNWNATLYFVIIIEKRNSLMSLCYYISNMIIWKWETFITPAQWAQSSWKIPNIITQNQTEHFKIYNSIW